MERESFWLLKSMDGPSLNVSCTLHNDRDRGDATQMFQYRAPRGRAVPSAPPVTPRRLLLVQKHRSQMKFTPPPCGRNRKDCRTSLQTVHDVHFLETLRDSGSPTGGMRIRSPLPPGDYIKLIVTHKAQGVVRITHNNKFPCRPLPHRLGTWRARENLAGGKGNTRGGYGADTALAENGAERKRRQMIGQKGKNHCGCQKPLSSRRCTH